MRPLRVAFSFFTIFPVARTASLKEITAACYLAPLAGAAIGLLAGLAAWGSNELFGAPVAAAAALAASLLLTGLHHTDGLADLGDALMARGDSQRRIEVLKDRTLGTGAAGALLLVYLATWAALLQIIAAGGSRILWSLVAAELAARAALLLNAAISKPSHPGSGSAFLAAAKSWRGFVGVASAIAALLLLMIPLGPAGPAAAAVAAVLVAFSLSYVGRLWFGGIGGDMLGATVELGRMAALMAIVAAVKAWPPV